MLFPLPAKADTLYRIANLGLLLLLTLPVWLVEVMQAGRQPLKVHMRGLRRVAGCSTQLILRPI